MLGTNKVISTKRQTGGMFTPYAANIASLRCRYEPTNVRSYNNKEEQLTFTLFSDIADIRTRDRVLHGAREFVVEGTLVYDDTMGQHIEVSMREVNSHLHEIVTVQRLASSQPDYDPILGEYIDNNKVYDNIDISVLFEGTTVNRDKFIDYVDNGVLDNTDMTMIVDLPDYVNITDKVVRLGVVFEVLWVIERPYYNEYGLKRALINNAA